MGDHCLEVHRREDVGVRTILRAKSHGSVLVTSLDEFFQIYEFRRGLHKVKRILLTCNLKAVCPHKCQLRRNC